MDKSISINLGIESAARIKSHPSFKLHAILSKRKVTLVVEDNDQLKIAAQIHDADMDETFMCCEFAQLKEKHLICIAGFGNIIKVADVLNSQFMFYLKGHGGWITCLKTHTMFKHILFSGASDATIRMWDLNKRRTLCIFGGIGGHRDQVLSIDVSLGGRYLVSSGHDCMIKIWRIPDQCFVCHRFHNKMDCTKENLIITKLNYPKFTSSDMHRSFITSVKFYGHFIISKANSNRIVIIKPFFKEDIIDTFEESNCQLIDIYFLKSGAYCYKFAADFNSKTLVIGSREIEGEFFLCDIDFDNPDRKAVQHYSNIHKKIRDISMINEYIYILFEDSTLQRIKHK